MTWPRHYSLVREHDKHFEIHDKRDDKTFHIAKKDLHPASQIKVMKMQKFYEGGQAKEVPDPVSMPDPQKAKDAWAGAQHGQADRFNHLLGIDKLLSTDKPVKKYKSGGVVPDYLNTPVNELNFPPPEEPFATRAGQYIGKVGSQAISDAFGPIKAIGSAISPMMDTAAQFVGGIGQGVAGDSLGISSAQAESLPAQPQFQNIPRTPSVEAQDTSTLPAVPPVDNSQFPTVAGMQSAERAYATGARNEVEAQKKKDAQMAELQDAHVQSLNWAKQTYDMDLNKIQQEHNNLSQAIADQKIDPRHFWNSKDTGGKIGSIIGIMLSGIGAGLQHSTQNMALELINKNIDRDIDAQKTELGKKQNLLSENVRKQGDLMRGEAITRMQLEASVEGQMKAIAAKTNNPILAAQAEQAIADRRLKMLPLQQALATSTAQMAQKQKMNALLQGKDLSHVDPAQLVEQVVPEHNRKKVYEEIEMAQNTKKMGGSILNAFEQAAKENTILKTGAGLLRTPGSVLALHQAMQPTFKDLEGTVRQAAMDNTFKNITPAPGDSEHKIEQKRQALTEYLQSKMSAPTAKGSGLDLNKFESTKTHEYAPPPVARQTSDGRIGLFDPTTKKFLGYK